METWEVKAFSADDVDGIIKSAREDFKEQAQKEDMGKCVQCGMDNVVRVQHFNDVGGPDTLCCEMCYVSNALWFQLNEDAPTNTNTIANTNESAK